MKKINLFFLMFLMGMFVFASCENDGAGDRGDTVEQADDVNEEKALGLEEDEAEFLTSAASGGMMEVQAAAFAMDKATTPEVKQYAEKLKADHEKANEQLKQLAQSKNVTLPTVMKEDHLEKVNKLKEKSGRDFDEAYIDLMIDEHKKDIDKFEDMAEEANDAEIKNFAATTVTTLRGHYDMAKNIEEQMERK